MIVEGYTLDLYCDCDKCAVAHEVEYEQFTGMSRTEVNKKAKAAGWYMERGIARNVTFAHGH